MGDNSKETFYLFSSPSFSEGMARTLDIGATFDAYNESETGAEADRRALGNDWRAVGKDIKFAMDEYDKRQSK